MCPAMNPDLRVVGAAAMAPMAQPPPSSIVTPTSTYAGWSGRREIRWASFVVVLIGVVLSVSATSANSVILYDCNNPPGKAVASLCAVVVLGLAETALLVLIANQLEAGGAKNFSLRAAESNARCCTAGWNVLWRGGRAFSLLIASLVSYAVVAGLVAVPGVLTWRTGKWGSRGHTKRRRAASYLQAYGAVHVTAAALLMVLGVYTATLFFGTADEHQLLQSNDFASVMRGQ